MRWTFRSNRALVLWAAAAAVAGAQTRSDYDAGLVALRDGRYEDAVRAFEQASASPREGAYPLYHLGKAHRCAGRVEAAKQAFEASFFSEDLGGRRDLLEARDRQLTDPPPPCADIPQVAPRAPTTTVPRRTTTTVASTSSAVTTTVARTTGAGSSAAADRAYTAGCADLDPLAPREAIGRFREATELDSSHERARRALENAERLAEILNAIGQESIRSAAETLSDVVEPCDGKETIPALEQELRAAALRKARRSVEARLEGDHEAAIEMLEDAIAGLEDRPIPHLYLGLYYYSQYILLGESVSELVEQARSHVGRALELDPNVEGDPRLFSPKLVRFVDQERRGHSQ